LRRQADSGGNRRISLVVLNHQNHSRSSRDLLRRLRGTCQHMEFRPEGGGANQE
jgi:hypothetical protein